MHAHVFNENKPHSIRLDANLGFLSCMSPLMYRQVRIVLKGLPAAHKSHSNSFSPVCIHMCLRNIIRCRLHLGKGLLTQMLLLNEFSFHVCTLLAAANIAFEWLITGMYPHMSHNKVRRINKVLLTEIHHI